MLTTISIIAGCVAIPVCLLVVVFLLLVMKPTRNELFGYRTTRSMRSEEAWDYANGLFCSLVLKLYTVILIVTVMLLAMCNLGGVRITSTAALVIILLQALPISGPIVTVERGLRRNFDRGGRDGSDRRDDNGSNDKTEK